MNSPPRSSQLRIRLADISEFDAAGFAVREGLTGAGITLLQGRSYFGSWRESQGRLVFVSASMNEPHHNAQSVDEAVRKTMLMVLRSLEVSQLVQPTRAAS